jgi:hypothetical protein
LSSNGFFRNAIWVRSCAISLSRLHRAPQAAGSPLVVSEFKFACTDADNNAFLSWNGVELKRGGGVVVTPPQPSDAPGTAAPKPDVPASTDCQGIAELLANPLSLLSGGCVKVEPFGGVFKTSPLDLKKIAEDIRANKPVTITGSYERPDAKFAVTCAVDAKTLTFLLPLLTATNPTIDVAAAKQNLGVACKTADGKRQFAIDGDAIRGVDVDGSTVKVGGRTLDLGKLVPDVVGGKTVLVGGFKLTGNELTTPDGRVITLTADDVLKFLSNRVAFIKGALGAVLTSDKGKVEIKDGKVAFTDSTGKTTTVSGARECSNAVPVGEKLAVSCDGAKYSVDEAGNLLPDVEIADISTTEKQKTAPSGAASLALAAVATVASLAIAFL